MSEKLDEMLQVDSRVNIQQLMKRAVSIGSR